MPISATPGHWPKIASSSVGEIWWLLYLSSSWYPWIRQCALD